MFYQPIIEFFKALIGWASLSEKSILHNCVVFDLKMQYQS